MYTPYEVQPTIRRGYIRLEPCPQFRLGTRYYNDDNLTLLPRFLQQYVVTSPKPALKYVYLVGLISPADENVLDWLIDQSRLLSDEKVEEWDRWTRQSHRRLKRSDFEVYLTREKAKSESGKWLLGRLAAESVTYYILSPSDIHNALKSMPEALHGVDASSLENGLDNYLLFFQSHFLVSQTSIIYSNWNHNARQHSEWWRSARDGKPEIAEGGFDYSTVRLQDRCNSRIERRCGCSGAHQKCPRPTDEGPQWLCPCGGPCKRRELCRQGQSRPNYGYKYPGLIIPWISNASCKRGYMTKELEAVTAEEFCRQFSVCAQGGTGTQGLDYVKALNSIDTFSADWKIE